MTGGMLVVFITFGTRWRAMRRAAHEALNIRATYRHHSILMRKEFGSLCISSQPQSNVAIMCNGMLYIKRSITIKLTAHSFTSSEIASFLYNDPQMESSQDPVIAFLTGFVDLIFPRLPYLRESKEAFRTHSAKFLKYFLNVKEKLLQKQDVGPSFCAMLVETHERHGLDDTESSWLAAMIYLAGHETTASSLDWLILAMLCFPEAQRKAQEELDNVIG
ncbi:hypothetical protein MPER_06743, partial [Moniliophthora perniciosa FA553]